MPQVSPMRLTSTPPSVLQPLTVPTPILHPAAATYRQAHVPLGWVMHVHLQCLEKHTQIHMYAMINMSRLEASASAAVTVCLKPSKV